MIESVSADRLPLVLMLDDGGNGLEMYAEYMRLKGLRIATAVDGVDAMDLMRRGERPAVILIDLELNGPPGTHTMRLLKADPVFCSIPIIAFTAYAMEDEREAALRDGFDFVMPKPCLPDDVIRVIQSYLSARGTDIG